MKCLLFRAFLPLAIFLTFSALNVPTVLASGSDFVWTAHALAPHPGSHGWSSVTSSSDGTLLAAVVFGGDIYTSSNSGATWTNETTGTALSGLGWQTITSSSDGTHLAAVVFGGDIYTSADGGTTWTDQTAAGSRLWTSITSSSDGTHLVAVVAAGDLWTGVLPSRPSFSTASGSGSGNGMIVGSGPLAPSPFSFFNYKPPVFQIIYPNGRVVFPATSSAASFISTSSFLSYVFSKNRQINDLGPDILFLQQFLNTRGFGVAARGPGSPGQETDFFGAGTYRALVKFQKANGLPSTGYFGPLTRALINSQSH